MSESTGAKIAVGISAEPPKAIVNIHVTSDTDGLATREYVDQKVEEAERGEIRTVNGQEPDENGDVQVRELPEVTNADTGKFLRVRADGTWGAEAVANAEEASF